ARFCVDLEYLLEQQDDLLQSLVRDSPRREAASETFFGEPPQVRRRRLACGHNLLGVFVTQLFQRKGAACGDRTRLVEPRRRIKALERGERAQMTLAVGKKRVTDFSNRRLETDRGQR